TWLPDVLTAAGLKIALVDGWQTRGRGDVGEIFGVICHHTGGSRNHNMPSLEVIREGRPDLPGPLAQLGLGRDGTFYVIAAGRCNHAGRGMWQKLTTGNTNFIGIEAENTGETSGPKNDFPWPQVQVDAYQRGVAAILAHIGRGAEFCAGHKEYALPAGRKDDPSFDMNVFRDHVAAILRGAAPAPVLIPSQEPSGATRPTLRRGATGPLVAAIQAKLQVAGPPTFGPKTEAALRLFQSAHGLVPDGIVGPATWVALDGVA
ncbi:MAG: N-acetylmuramoyl-L-alanine amidase, partial [Acidobacteria bacterium]|nr:N-acetylmuramoyl-L-alanine amidase [Acidobacteriota bacterium]